MEPKKNPKKDLSKRIPVHFLIGLNIALLLTLTAFEWKTEHGNLIVITTELDGMLWDQTIVLQTPPPLPPKPIIIVTPTPVDIEPEEIPDLPELDIEMPESIPDIESEIPAPPVEVAEEPETFVDVEVEYPGGWEAFYTFMGREIDYPDRARRVGLEGKVYVEFIIEKDGSVTNIQILKGFDQACEEETMRVLAMLPEKFEPARIEGRVVRRKMVMPILFKLGH